MNLKPERGASKRCYKCERVLPLASFSRNIKRYDGRQNQCRSCDRERARLRYHRKKEQEALAPVRDPKKAEWPKWEMELM